MTSKEAFQTKCLDEMTGFAWKYQANRYGPFNATAILWRFQNENEFVLESDGKFDVPPKSGNLALNMARFARATLGKPVRIEGYRGDFIPEPVFSLQALLYAAFPVNCETSKFRWHDAGLAAGEPLSPEGQLRAAHIAFGGLGNIIMGQCRTAFGELLSNVEVLAKAESYWISIIDEPEKS